MFFLRNAWGGAERASVSPEDTRLNHAASSDAFDRAQRDEHADHRVISLLLPTASKPDTVDEQLQMPENLTDAQRALADYMSELSEEAYCAGWMQDLEFALWEAIRGGRREYGHMVLSEAQIETLQKLSEQCGGWIVYDDRSGETWVEIGDWERRFLAGPVSKRELGRLRGLIPTHKSDVDRAHAVVATGYPAVAPILHELVEWLRDCNWPVAHVLRPFLCSIGTPLVPHIWHVLRSDDGVWKYWIIGSVIPTLDEKIAVQFRPELERLSSAPYSEERADELDQQATDVLRHFGWRSAAS